MEWKVIFYSEKVRKAIDEWPMHLQARFVKLLDAMIIHGSHLGEPHTKALGDGLFELRIKASEGISRVFYCTQVNKTIVMLHAFIKKSQAIPQKELEIARKRLKEVKNYGKKD